MLDARDDSMPSNTTEPDVASSSRSTTRPVVDLPQPDSPTRPRVWRLATLKLTPDTACTVPTRRRISPCSIGNSLTRSLHLEQRAVSASTSAVSLRLVAVTASLMIAACSLSRGVVDRLAPRCSRAAVSAKWQADTWP